jgi:hypothetical protein
MLQLFEISGEIAGLFALLVKALKKPIEAI